ncbi:hypothetical protein SAMN04488057_104155 [Cyclobacterium lianum]|uniref:Uncharacterized protein n=1 Tax=Cyclobacterium lianum TaxID=388280 RepID=A0A1M7M9G4_9BACT|nr:hypothetical protein SAMN04488057_104155 [Cyclobacterium lianum]
MKELFEDFHYLIFRRDEKEFLRHYMSTQNYLLSTPIKRRNLPSKNFLAVIFTPIT